MKLSTGLIPSFRAFDFVCTAGYDSEKDKFSAPINSLWHILFCKTVHSISLFVQMYYELHKYLFSI